MATEYVAPYNTPADPWALDVAEIKQYLYRLHDGGIGVRGYISPPYKPSINIDTVTEPGTLAGGLATATTNDYFTINSPLPARPHMSVDYAKCTRDFIMLLARMYVSKIYRFDLRLSAKHTLGAVCVSSAGTHQDCIGQFAVVFDHQDLADIYNNDHVPLTVSFITPAPNHYGMSVAQFTRVCSLPQYTVPAVVRPPEEPLSPGEIVEDYDPYESDSASGGLDNGVGSSPPLPVSPKRVPSPSVIQLLEQEDGHTATDMVDVPEPLYEQVAEAPPPPLAEPVTEPPPAPEPAEYRPIVYARWSNDQVCQWAERVCPAFGSVFRKHGIAGRDLDLISGSEWVPHFTKRMCDYYTFKRALELLGTEPAVEPAKKPPLDFAALCSVILPNTKVPIVRAASKAAKKPKRGVAITVAMENRICNTLVSRYKNAMQRERATTIAIANELFPECSSMFTDRWFNYFMRRRMDIF